jgi:glutaconate CoA-transferase subunit A
LPGAIVDAVVVEPWGAHPSYVQGVYDRDNAFYRAWDAISREPARLEAWLGAWVHDLPDRAAYVEHLGPATLARLAPDGPALAGPVDYGAYR